MGSILQEERDIRSWFCWLSPGLMLQQGLTRSLGGKIEAITLVTGSYKEDKDAFGLTREKYIWLRGFYPVQFTLKEDEIAWKNLRDGRHCSRRVISKRTWCWLEWITGGSDEKTDCSRLGRLIPVRFPQLHKVMGQLARCRKKPLTDSG